MTEKQNSDSEKRLNFIKKRGIYVPQRERWISLKEKTAWDWLQLLIVPAFLAIGTYVLQSRSAENQNLATTSQYRQGVLANYLNEMTQLILDRGLLTRSSNSLVTSIARAKTLTALRELDGRRKGILLLFLVETKLITKKNPVIDMRNADLQKAYLWNASLKEVNLRGAYFSGANLEESNLEGSNLSEVQLWQANLMGVKLKDTNLKSANLSLANLKESDLSNANLNRVNLRNTDLRDANLNQADLKDAFYSLQTKLPNGFDPTNRRMYLLAPKSDLRGADLRGADLRNADLRGADLRNANLKGANLKGSLMTHALLCNTTMPNGTVEKRDCP